MKCANCEKWEKAKNIFLYKIKLWKNCNTKTSVYWTNQTKTLKQVLPTSCRKNLHTQVLIMLNVTWLRIKRFKFYKMYRIKDSLCPCCQSESFIRYKVCIFMCKFCWKTDNTRGKTCDFQLWAVLDTPTRSLLKPLGCWLLVGQPGTFSCTWPNSLQRRAAVTHTDYLSNHNVTYRHVRSQSIRRVTLGPNSHLVIFLTFGNFFNN